MTPAQHLTWDSRPGADGSDEHTCGDCAICHEIAERALHKADGGNP